MKEAAILSVLDCGSFAEAVNEFGLGNDAAPWKRLGQIAAGRVLLQHKGLACLSKRKPEPVEVEELEVSPSKPVAIYSNEDFQSKKGRKLPVRAAAFHCIDCGAPLSHGGQTRITPMQRCQLHALAHRYYSHTML